MSKVKLGKKLPDFSLPATGEGTFKLSEQRGKKLVLYFYPKDSTPGCTREGQDFRDAAEDFAAAGALIFGISRDTMRRHENFKAKQEFNFELLSDEDETVCRLFDVMKLKKLYGREYMGIERSTFLIDAAGVLSHEWRKVKVAGHVAEVLEACREIEEVSAG